MKTMSVLQFDNTFREVTPSISSFSLSLPVSLSPSLPASLSLQLVTATQWELPARHATRRRGNALARTG